MKHVNGGKFKSRHTTVTDAAYRVAMAANKSDCVHIIRPGDIISGLHGHNTRLRIMTRGNVLTMKVFEAHSMQILKVVTSDPKNARADILVNLYGNQKGGCPEPG